MLLFCNGSSSKRCFLGIKAKLTQDFILPLVILSCLSLFSYTPTTAQCSVTDYSFSSSIGTFSPISSGTRVPNIETTAGASSALPIGFSFTYLGRNYTQFYMYSRGYVSFTPINNLTTPLSTINAPILAPLRGELNGSFSAASYQLTGTAPNRVLTLE